MSIKTPPLTRSAIIQHLVSTYGKWREVQNHFPKKSRFTLGTKIDDKFLDVTESIYIANYLSGSQKLPYVQQAIRRLDLLKFLLQIAWEIKDIDNKKYIALSEPLAEIGRMLGGWSKNLQKKIG